MIRQVEVLLRRVTLSLEHDRDAGRFVGGSGDDVGAHDEKSET